MTVVNDESWIDPIFDAVVSDVQATGYFDRVNQHELKRRPQTKMAASVWAQSITPIGEISGLANTSGRILFIVRMYKNMLGQPQDAIEPIMLKAASNIMRRYHDDFDFGGVIRNVDLLGQFGISLDAQAGYLEIEKVMHRIYDIQVPCLVNDIWPQTK